MVFITTNIDHAVVSLNTLVTVVKSWPVLSLGAFIIEICLRAEHTV